MSTKRITILSALLILAGNNLSAQDNTVQDKTNNTEYNPEIGYFQKAYTDLGDPEFMYGNEKFTMGLGGTVRASAFFDLHGSPDGSAAKFSASKLSVPTDNANKFGMSASSSELHLKARSHIGKHTIIAFIKALGNDNDDVKLNQAYVSIDGLTIGKVYSFFMDLEAGAKTVDLLGPNTQIANIQPLIGYTLPLGKHWTFGVSAEKPEVKAEERPEWGVELDNQSMPDFVLKAKYKWNTGSIQVSGLVRNMSFWKHERGTVLANEGETRHTLGWGAALSGTFRPTKSIQISFQDYYGKGISRYINDISSLQLDMGVTSFNASTGLCEEMEPIPIHGGYIACSCKWTKSLSSNFLWGYLNVKHPDGMNISDNLKLSTYGAANLFYTVNKYCSIGLEYTGGIRKNYKEADEDDTGEGNRINTTFIFQF